MVWICEYPYRTVRLTGPGAECADCPFRPSAEAPAEPTPIDHPLAS